jgi:MFS family permease
MASHFTSNLRILALIFSLCYAAVPMIGLAVSYLICRPRRELFIWPALAIGLGTLPGIFAFNYEAIIVASLFWPVLLAVLIGVNSGVEFVLVVLLAVAALISHPTATAFFAIGAGIGYLSARRSPRKLPRYTSAFALGILALIRLVMPIEGYERGQLAIATLRDNFTLALNGWPLAVVVLTFVAAILCLIEGTRRNSLTFTTDLALLATIIVAGLMLVPWSSNPHLWWRESKYRTWMVPIHGALMVTCALDAWREADREFLWRQRQPALIAIGAVFLIVLSIQSARWDQLTRRLQNAMRGGCIPAESLSWIEHTPLDHWSLSAYAIDLQGRTPRSLVLNRIYCDQFAANGKVRLSFFSIENGHWFDFSQVLAAAPNR